MTLHQQIKSYSLQNSTEEICGLIVDNQAFICKNIAKDKAKFYKIDPQDYLKISLTNKISGTFHSHVQGKAALSYLDILNSENHQINTIIYSIKQDKFLEYKPCNFRIDYIGREFSIGKSDCCSIIRDYYQKELNIKINDNYFRNDDWQKNEPDLCEKSFRAEEFIEVNDLKKNDVLLFKFPGKEFCHHAGVYLENSFLHHERNKYSTIELYDGAYKKYTEKVLRYAG